MAAGIGVFTAQDGLFVRRSDPNDLVELSAGGSFKRGELGRLLPQK
jgi:hypothetical protein